MRFFTNAAERMRIDSSGNVGIGTSSPGATLHLNKSGTSDFTNLYLSNSGASGKSYQIGVGGNSTGAGYANNLYIYDNSAAAARVTLDSSGNVGIGTSSPSMKVNISHADQDGLRFNSAASGETFIDFADPDDNDIGRISYDHNDNHMAFRTNNGERMRISSSGQVMIGTTTAGSGDADDLTVATSGHGGITIRSGSSHAAAIYFSDGTSGSQNYQGIFQYVHSADELQFYTNYAANSNPRMRIDYLGNVGIDFAPKVMHANVTSSLNVGSSSLFQRTKNTFVSSNFYYNSSDVGKSIASGHALVYHQDVTNGAHIWFRTGSASGADESVSLTESMRIDSSGRLLVGTTSAPTGGDWAQYSKAIFTGSTGSTADAGTISLKRGGTAANGNPLGVLSFSDNNGGEFAYMKCEADGTTGSSDYPGRLVFSTTADGASARRSECVSTTWGL